MENNLSKISPANRVSEVSEYYFSRKLKEVAAMNTSIKAWSNIPLPKKKTIDADFSEK